MHARVARPREPEQGDGEAYARPPHLAHPRLRDVPAAHFAHAALVVSLLQEVCEGANGDADYDTEEGEANADGGEAVTGWAKYEVTMHIWSARDGTRREETHNAVLKRKDRP